MELDHLCRQPYEYGAKERLDHVGQNPGGNGWPMEPKERELLPPWREVLHRAADVLRSACRWGTPASGR